MSYEATLDDVYDDFPDSILGAAIAQGSCDFIKVLKIAGVTPEGHRIPCIPNMETLCCLQAIGFLPIILQNSGQMILTCAILQANDDGLVKVLLDLNVDQCETRLGPLENFKHWSDSLSLPECRTPLEAALTRRNLPLARTLISRGATPTEHDLNAIVWQAVVTDNDKLVLQFLSMIPSPFSGPTAFGIAVLWGRTSLVQSLLNFGINPKGIVYITDPPEEADETAPQTAGWWHLEPEEYAPSLLQVAASKGDYEILQLLLSSVEWSEVDRGCALTTSLFWENYHLVPDLLAAGAGVNQGILETSAVSDK